MVGGLKWSSLQGFLFLAENSSVLKTGQAVAVVKMLEEAVGEMKSQLPGWVPAPCSPGLYLISPPLR